MELQVKRKKELAKLEKVIQYRFKTLEVLNHTMMHKSFVNENLEPGLRDNGALEFLGDAILGFVISDLLYRTFSDLNEGTLSKMKAYLVSTSNLAQKAESLKLGKYLLLGKGEEKTQGRKKESLLADSFESLIAGIFLDGGMNCVRKFLKKEFKEQIINLGQNMAEVVDYKSALQEHVQSYNLPNPFYKILEELGPDHEKTFVMELQICKKGISRGEGKSKKEAQQQAAARALKVIHKKGLEKILGEKVPVQQKKGKKSKDSAPLA